jgi:hypothetical protein
VKKKNKFTGQERVLHKPVVCANCGLKGGIKGTPPLRKISKGDRTWYVHHGSCPIPLNLPKGDNDEKVLDDSQG